MLRLAAYRLSPVPGIQLIVLAQISEELFARRHVVLCEGLASYFVVAFGYDPGEWIERQFAFVDLMLHCRT